MPKSITMRELLEKELPKQPMYIESAVLPKGGTMVIGGQTKIGKSFVVNSFLRSLSSGGSLFGLSQFAVEEPVRCLYVEGEVGEQGDQTRAQLTYDGLSPRDLDRMHIVTKELALDMRLDETAGYRLLAEEVKVVAPQVLVIDPLAAFHATDENDNTGFEEIFRRIEKLKAIHPERRMAVIIVHHAGKPNKETDPLSHYAMRGATKIVDRADSLLMLDRRPNLAVDWEAWPLDARFKLRQGPGFDDLKIHVNEHNDGQVRFNSWKSTTGALSKLSIVRKGASGAVTTTAGTQLGFDAA